ncbi:MAG: GIY-YIG nuclease family protein [Ignavibacteriales bacterium]|nr:MAG: GIY-YIG nuclease family protein [Ignavibacteriales bacterium]
MKCFVYILQSESSGKYYIGISENPDRRLEFHNTLEKGFTSRYRPWKIVYTKEFSDRTSAHKVELKLKSWKSKIIMERVISGEIIL